MADTPNVERPKTARHRFSTGEGGRLEISPTIRGYPLENLGPRSTRETVVWGVCTKSSVWVPVGQPSHRRNANLVIRKMDHDGPMVGGVEVVATRQDAIEHRAPPWTISPGATGVHNDSGVHRGDELRNRGPGRAVVRQKEHVGAQVFVLHEPALRSLLDIPAEQDAAPTVANSKNQRRIVGP